MLQGMFSTQSFAPVGARGDDDRTSTARCWRAASSRASPRFSSRSSSAGRSPDELQRGQNPPLLFSAAGVRKLETGGMIVGLFPHATYEQEEVQLTAGDLLAVFSDGVSEALNPAGDEYGEAHIQEVVAQNWLAPSDAVLQTLLASVRGFCAGRAAERRRDRARRALHAASCP